MVFGRVHALEGERVVHCLAGGGEGVGLEGGGVGFEVLFAALGDGGIFAAGRRLVTGEKSLCL